MARKNKDGRYILAAGEVAHFIVCPEAWRLSVVEKNRGSSDPSHQSGRELHTKWAKDYTDSVYLSRGVRILIELCLLMVLLYLLKVSA
jgi:hypothetical protein